ncbi:hypothetical protein B2J93_1598 [Marssonina coronariae]|uniref:Uncharacterized protein n=1 Tax=Diplocarpon coronariae TaxID=2795749 RepID=A0A218Z8L8_9HELO|nr:hypothetical protein B2J93_1598 [Marssonina coronariae]
MAADDICGPGRAEPTSPSQTSEPSGSSARPSTWVLAAPDRGPLPVRRAEPKKDICRRDRRPVVGGVICARARVGIRHVITLARGPPATRAPGFSASRGCPVPARTGAARPTAPESQSPSEDVTRE